MENKGKLIGIIILVAIIIAAVVIAQFVRGGHGGLLIKETKTIKGLIGGEKKGFLENPKVIDILKSRYGLIIDWRKAGSIDMVMGDITGYDFLWPSSQVALEIFKIEKTNSQVKDQVIFNSPIVLYSWDIVTDALIKAGIVKELDKTYYIVDMPKLIGLLMGGKKWEDIGLSELYGKISIFSTDPRESNSGNMFAGLLANMLLGDVATKESIDKILPELVQFFKSLGYMETSSSDLFESYLKMGVGARPIIVGYESQIIEFMLQHPDFWPKVKDKIRILYPVPTVWSAHPLIALTDDAKDFINALQDKEIQKIAWEENGFRTGLIGVDNDPKVLDIAGIPAEITKVVPMPEAKVMLKIIAELKK